MFLLVVFTMAKIIEMEQVERIPTKIKLSAKTLKPIVEKIVSSILYTLI